MAHVQQIAPLIQKANIQFMDSPRTFTSIG